ncbi:MAG: hydroxyglutarate oxidase [Melioribacteraceae bacterium]|nr:MAG: hydroxyglutarate oxidase [Melioribacteraceae bacterium]
MTYDIIIIGAGIVGLATAYKILEKEPNKKILVLEKENGVSKHQTGNNSGVIHSGIYYKPGSLKATNCRRGYKYLIDFCDVNDIKYDLCGKVIVAVTESEIPQLDKIYDRGIENGLKNLKKLSGEEVREIEPNVAGVAGIFVPQTGIIDYKVVSQKLADIIREKGADIQFGQEVTGISEKTDDIEVVTKSSTFSSKLLISCAGLQSDRIAKLTHPDLPVKIVPFRGEYYKIKEEKRSLVKNLIYPVPDPAFPFLGVHFTRMIDGEVEAGPNAVLSFKREGYSKFSFNAGDAIETFAWKGFRKVMYKFWKTGMGEFYRSYSKGAFVKALQRLMPSITAEDLTPGGAGIRAQACDKEGGLIDDFYIVGDGRVFHVCNAPSPAATASLSIGEHIRDKILG